MLEWLERQLELNNFGAIFDKIVRDNSLRGICGTVADAVYKEFDNLYSDRNLCLRIIQAMLEKGWLGAIQEIISTVCHHDSASNTW